MLLKKRLYSSGFSFPAEWNLLQHTLGTTAVKAKSDKRGNMLEDLYLKEDMINI